jgi:hypothetical protein
MAQPYLDQLTRLVEPHLTDDADLVCKHFFSGAALYAHGAICTSLSPVGLAVKLPVELCAELIDSGLAAEMRYFPKAPVKKGYALFAAVDDLSESDIAKYLKMAIAHAGRSDD